jgi:hypothetical protein
MILKIRYRQYAIWDSRDLSKPVKMTSFDSSTGQLIPLYDEDTETMYILGRGDSTIRSFQLSGLQSEPTVAENMACGTNTSLFGACLLPKLSLNVMKAEVARVMTLTSNAVVPVSFEVPRKVSQRTVVAFGHPTPSITVPFLFSTAIPRFPRRTISRHKGKWYVVLYLFLSLLSKELYADIPSC